MQLFPYLDRADVIDYINQASTPALATTAVQSVLAQSYTVLQCPNDVNHFKQQGGLSYAANIGYGSWTSSAMGITPAYDHMQTDHNTGSYDWNNNMSTVADATDKQYQRATGVFWHADTDNYRMTLDSINQGDGTSSTILFVESLNLVPMHTTGSAGFNPGAIQIGSGMSLLSTNLIKSTTPSLYVNSGLGANSTYQTYFKPNMNRGTMIGNWPAPTSLHTGVINVVFAGGNTGTISQDINWAVLASLYSPMGVRYGQVPVSESQY
jgi:hypothetical protein